MPLDQRQLAALFLCSSLAVLHAQEPAKSTAESGATLWLSVDSVLVPVVVRDAQGRVVGELKAGDFKVFDQGKPRKISGFSIEKNEPPPLQSSTASPVAGSNAPSGVAVTQPRTIALLFDDRHLGVAELEQAKKAALQLLNQPLPDGTRGLVLSFLGVNSGITHDRAVLQAAIAKVSARQGTRQDATQCPRLTYYQADQIINRHNGAEFQIAIEKAETCTVSVRDPRMLEELARNAANQSLLVGEQDARDTLDSLRDVVQSLSRLPGERSLVVISPGFLAIEDEAMNRASWILDMAASANLTISTIDARGIYGELMAASESGAGSIFATITGQTQQDDADALRQNKQIMAELADGAGGTFFHNSNDLAGGLADLIAPPEYRYLLEVPIGGTKQNGAYHTLRVEVEGKGLRVQAREGYFAPAVSKRSKGNDKKTESEEAAPTSPPSVQGASSSATVPAPPSVQSASSPTDSIPAAAPQPQAPRQATYARDPSPAAPAEDATTYYQLPVGRLKDAVPGLKGIQYDPSQQQLQSILDRVAQKIADVLPRLPNLISREQVLHFQGSWDPDAPGGLAAAQPWTRDFKYLIQCQHNADGSTSLSESRIDSKGNVVKGAEAFTALRGYGFAYQWLFFSAANQHEFRFRYLGEQQKNGRKTFVVAFAQDPHKVDDPAYFMSDGKTAPFYYQGVFWVDQASFDIVALRTDLLAPLPGMLLKQLTTQLTFRSVPIRGYDAVFWLPSEVDISSDQGRGPTEESHRYSDYHLFHAEAQIVTGP